MADTLTYQPETLWSLARGWFERRRRGILLVMLVLMFVITALAPRIFITIPAGHGGIIWLRFFGGTQTNEPALGEGLHIIFPWDEIYIYDMRVQERDQSFAVIAREGLQVSVTSSFRWQLNRASLPRLHKDIGPNYLQVLLIPEVGSVLRERISQYDIEELFSSRRTQIQREILKGIVAEAPGEAENRIGGAGHSEDQENYVTITDILLKDVTLPFRLQSAIERKLEQAQISQEYTFRIEREKLESQRKQIEAQGIQAFQTTVQTGISEAYLKWRGIEATLQLATSPNAKVVVVGGGSQGLPLILNTEDNLHNRIPAVPAPAPRIDPSKLQKADAEDGGRIAGSVDMTPPVTANTSVEHLVAPGGVAEAAKERATKDAAELVSESAADAPPQILRSFADAFGYRLQPIAPPNSASVVPPANQPR